MAKEERVIMVKEKTKVVAKVDGTMFGVLAVVVVKDVDVDSKEVPRKVRAQTRVKEKEKTKDTKEESLKERTKEDVSTVVILITSAEIVPEVVAGKEEWTKLNKSSLETSNNNLFNHNKSLVKFCMRDEDKKNNEKVSTTLYVDSSSAKALMLRRECGRLQHLDIRYLWLQSMVRQQLVFISKVGTKNNPADIYTKPLILNRRQYLRRVF